MTESAKIPTRGTSGSAGLDIYSDESVILKSQQVVPIRTGIAIELPPGTVGLFLDKSSLGSSGIHNFAGVIDSDYRGELFVVLYNSTDHDIVLEHGRKITQLVVIPFISLHPYEIETLSNTERGSSGFGSTGAF